MFSEMGLHAMSALLRLFALRSKTRWGLLPVRGCWGVSLSIRYPRFALFSSSACIEISRRRGN